MSSGQKQYAFCRHRPKEAAVHLASSPSSRNAKAALQKAAARFGKNIKVVNDNGSENMKDAENYLASLNIPQYWTRPKSPKEKPFAERLIGTLQRECLDYNYAP
jgi:transposase InsO family protein